MLLFSDGEFSLPSLPSLTCDSSCSFYFVGDLQLLRLRYRHLHHHLHRHLQEDCHQEDCHQEDQEGVEVVSLLEVQLVALFELYT